MIHHRNTRTILFIVFIMILTTACSPVQAPTSNDPLVDQQQSQSSDPLNVVPEKTSQDDQVIKIYLSADQTVSKSSGRAIEQGINVALSQVDWTIHGRPVEVVILDHKGSSPRAKQHLDDYLADDQALVVFSGLHSPPILENMAFINENDILMLDPWAAAGPITRYDSQENWIFRLSVDDTKAGRYITEFAIGEGFTKPYLILEDTGWGRSNQNTMTSALVDLERSHSGIEWFNWSLGINQAKQILRQAKASGADVIFFVGNAPEGKVFVEAMTQLDQKDRLPIRSHWGITGGDFPQVINQEMRSSVDLKFLQTSFSFVDLVDHPIATDVLKRAYDLYPNELSQPEDIQAPTGFIHGYDLTLLMLEALDQVDPDLSTMEKRDALRLALENINGPVQGLVKSYSRPFSVFSEGNLDAHEALGIDDLKMATYGPENEIRLEQ